MKSSGVSRFSPPRSGWRLSRLRPKSPSGPVGHWEGPIQVPGQELAISVDLALNAEARWEGTIAIPTQNVKALPLSDITVKGSAVGFAMKGVPGDPQFAGTVSKDGRQVDRRRLQSGRRDAAVHAHLERRS